MVQTNVGIASLRIHGRAPVGLSIDRGASCIGTIPGDEGSWHMRRHVRCLILSSIVCTCHSQYS
jgi:hypothetical protein